MPTSRKRRPRRSSSTHRPRRAQHPDDLRPYLEVALRADEAEARGDAAGALEELMRMPFAPDGGPLWRPWRLRRLTQLVTYDDHLSRWATSRWVLDQALQTLTGDFRSRMSRALIVATSVGADDQLPADLDPTDRQVRIIDRDWVYRQVFLYELGGLDTFVRTVAAPDLLVAADDLRLWGRAPLDGYRFVRSTSHEITWEELSSGRLLEVGNLGGAALLLPGEFVLGRLVPIEGGEMFESVPLRVTEAVARQVAESPSSWIDVLRSAHEADGQTQEPIRTAGFEFGLLHDVPPVIWEMVLGEVGGFGAGISEPLEPTALAQAALALARAAGGSPLPAGFGPARAGEELDGWPCLAAALLEPIVLEELRLLLSPGDAAVLEALAGRLPEPVAAVCRSLSFSCRSVA